MNFNIKIITNKPKFEYQNLCFKVLKQYCFINDYELVFSDDITEKDNHSDYLVFLRNDILIIDKNYKIEYLIEKYDDLNILTYDYMNPPDMYIFKNTTKNFNILFDKIKNIENFNINKYSDENISKVYINYLNENNSYQNNDSLLNEKFLKNLKNDELWLFILYNKNIDNVINDDIYSIVYNKFYNDKIILNIPKIISKEDEEIFNENNDIGFVTLYTKEILEEGKEMVHCLKEYCLKNKYTFYIHRKNILPDRHPTLAKPYLLKKYLKNHKYLIWIDSDILCLKHYFKIEQILNNEDFIAFNDPNENVLFNAGFLIFKNSENSEKLLDEWIKIIEEKDIKDINSECRGDQGPINDIIRNNFLENYKIYKNDKINVELRKLNSETIFLHLMGVYGFMRDVYMKYFNYKLFSNRSLYMKDDNKKHLGGSIRGGDKSTWSPQLWDFLIDDLKINSLIDVGCAEGLTLEYFINKNIDNVIGVEGLEESYNISNVKKHIILHDYTTGNVDINSGYDLTWCCEFVEHIEEKYIQNFIDTFKKSKYVAMTHAFPDQPGYHHVNCQLPEYWIKKLESEGFEYLSEYTLKLRHMTEKEAIHIKRSLLFFKNKNEN